MAETFRLSFPVRLLDDPPPKFWLVRDVIADGELSVVFGAPGDGKSVLVGDMACHAASGLDWFGHRVEKPVAVLYVAAERANLVRRRVSAFMRERGVTDMRMAIIDDAPDLANPEDLRRLFNTMDVAANHDDAQGAAWTGDSIETCFDGFQWIIIDTKARTMGGADENAAKDMNRYVAGLAKLQSPLGMHVTVIDHTPHSDKARMRGHGSLLGAADVTYRVSKAGGHRLFEIDKVNDGKDDISHAFTLRSITLRTDDEGNEETAPVVEAVGAISDPGTPRRVQKLSDRQKRAVEALAETINVSGIVAPLSFGLPFEMRTASLVEWRDTLTMRDVIPLESKNRSADFIRLKEALAARHIIAIREERVWLTV